MPSSIDCLQRTSKEDMSSAVNSPDKELIFRWAGGPADASLCKADLATIADVSLPASAQILVLQSVKPVPAREGLIMSLSVSLAETIKPGQDGEHAGEDCYRPFGSPFCLIGLSSSLLLLYSQQTAAAVRPSVSKTFQVRQAAAVLITSSFIPLSRNAEAILGKWLCGHWPRPSTSKSTSVSCRRLRRL